MGWKVCNSSTRDLCVMKIAVTGASGFIGQYVLKNLLEYEVDIVAVTRDSSRLTVFSEALHIVEMDISQPSLNCFEEMGRPDVLIHLAWGGLPNYKSLHHFETELPTQYHFLKSMIEAGLPSLMVTGTCFEYGMQSGSLASDLLTKPGNPYGYAKDALRKQLEYLKSHISFSFTWARLFYMYGEGQSDSSLYTQLKDAVSRRDKIFNMSGGEQLRDYLHVDEVTHQLVQLALAKCDVGPVNICSGTPISIRKLVENWLHDNNWKIELNLGYYPYPDYEPMAFWGKKLDINILLDD